MEDSFYMERLNIFIDRSKNHSWSRFKNKKSLGFVIPIPLNSLNKSSDKRNFTSAVDKYLQIFRKTARDSPQTNGLNVVFKLYNVES